MTETRNVRVRLSADTAAYIRDMERAAAATDRGMGRARGEVDKTSVSVDRLSVNLGGMADEATRGGSELDRFSGRAAILRDALITIGPAAVPITAAAIPAITGLSSALGFTAVGAGVAVAGFQGVGDALDALNAAQLEPTQANLDKARQAMEQLSPAARSIVTELDRLGPALTDLRDTSAAGLAPGIAESADNLLRLLPRLRGLFEETATAAGELAAESTESLASERWRPFIDFLEQETPQALDDVGTAVGALTHGLAELWMAFDPLNDDFSRWLVDQARAFDDWAARLDQTDGFREFVDYVQESGPQVADSLGAVGGALVEVVQAVAPLGGPSLKIIETFADALGAVADSDIGTPLLAGVGALVAYNRTLKVTAALQRQMGGGLFVGTRAATRDAVAGFRDSEKAARAAIPTMGQFGTVAYRAGQSTQHATDRTLAARSAVRGFSSQLASGAGRIGRFAGPMAGLALATTDLGDSMLSTGTATGAMIGMIGGPWGAAVGAGAGLLYDMANAGDELEGAIAQASAAMRSMDPQALGSAREQLEGLLSSQREALASSGFLDTITGSWAEFGAIINGVTGTTEEAERALARLNNAAASRSDLAGLLTPQAGEIGRAFDIATQSLDQFADSFGRLNGMLARSGSLIAYEAALDDLSASIKENGQAWNVGTAAGRSNLESRNRLINEAITRSQQLKEAGDALGAQRILTRAIGDLRQLAGDSPKAQAALRPLIRALEDLDGTEAKPTVDVNTASAKRKITAADRDLARFGGLRPTPTADMNNRPLLAVYGNSLTATRNLDRQRPKPTADMADGPFRARYRAVTADLRRLDGDRASPTVTVDDLASAKLRGIRAELATIQSKTIYIDTVRRAPSTSGFGPQIRNAAGGPIVTAHPVLPAQLLHDPEEVPA